MAEQIYTRPITDTLNDAIDIKKFTKEFENSSIASTMLDYPKGGVLLSGTDILIHTKGALSSADEATMDALLAAHDGVSATVEEPPTSVQLSVVQADNVPVVAVEPRIAKAANYTTHNLCLPTSWYSESTRINGEALIGVNNRWYSQNQTWIDVNHGHINDEEAIIRNQKIFEPGDPHGYAVQVTVDGVAKVEDNPMLGINGDYKINYKEGYVCPISEDWTGKAVVANYSHESGSAWIMKPLEGKALLIEKSEVQFSDPLGFNTSIRMDVYGNADFFAPELGLPSGTSIPIQETIYKTMDQFIDESVGAFPRIEPIGGAERGIIRPRHVFQFFYPGVKGIFGSLGMYVKISLIDDIPIEGERATATFYCTSHNDTDPIQALKNLGAI